MDLMDYKVVVNHIYCPIESNPNGVILLLVASFVSNRGWLQTSHIVTYPSIIFKLWPVNLPPLKRTLHSFPLIRPGVQPLIFWCAGEGETVDDRPSVRSSKGRKRWATGWTFYQVGRVATTCQNLGGRLGRGLKMVVVRWGGPFFGGFLKKGGWK